MTSSDILATTANHAETVTETTTAAPSYSIVVAGTPDEVVAAQRLRHLVFAEEMGARLHSTVPGLDADEFDPHCDHLLVREDGSGEIVGAYRMLPPHRAAKLGRLYSDGEFELTNINPLRDVLVETGRSCVHPDHRNGAVINLMWTGIARYLHLHRHRWLAGCASVPLHDGGQTAAAVWEVVKSKHLSPPRLRVTPRIPYAMHESTMDRAVMARAVPPLLKGYLRLGAWVCGEPALDADFGVADFYVLLSLDRVDPRYMKHFLGDGLGDGGA